jgi:allophanate hydrolase subunit 2
MGGYAKIATVISTDIPNIAQAIPGDSIQFEKVSLETAHVLYREQQNRMLEIAKKLAEQ